MPTTCDEILLDPYYSAIASGGPEFVTAVIRSGEGGAVGHRNINREDFISKYEVEFGQLESSRKKNLRNFGILRQGMARAFRFLAPDDSQLVQESLGKLHAPTGEVVYMDQTDGVLTDFYAIQHFSDPFINYTRRICKISPYEPVLIEIFDVNDPSGPAVTAIIFAADPFYNLYYDSVIQTKSGALSKTHSTRTVVLNYWLGKITITPALPSGLVPRITCQYHLPVVFTDDWQKFSIDEVATGARSVSVEEILPVELGIV